MIILLKIANFTSSACMIPFSYGGVDQYFCANIESQFKCQLNSDPAGTYSVCNLGKYLLEVIKIVIISIKFLITTRKIFKS